MNQPQKKQTNKKNYNQDENIDNHKENIQKILELKDYLDEYVEKYKNKKFITTDPIQIPYSFEKKEDIEISGFLASIIAWGNRASIIKDSKKMLNFMNNSPYEFILNHSNKDLKNIKGSIHRTFNSDDLIFFIKSLRNIYENYGGLEKVFTSEKKEEDTFGSIERFRTIFLCQEHLQRTEKHIASPMKKSAAKRINMFLRWMVRDDEVDFGIWKTLDSSQLVCPLDVHVGRIGRKLGILTRTQNDWKSATEITSNLKILDPKDPLKYDFALFGLGVFNE